MQTGVIIPNHNYGRWVLCALYSATEQSIKPKRIVVVDDGSTDDSLQVLSEAFSASWELNEQGKGKISGTINGVEVLAIHWAKAQGPSYARNYGIGLLSQDDEVGIYAFLDSDDYYYPEYLEKTTSKIINDPNYVGVVYTDSMIMDVKQKQHLPKYWEPFDRAKLVDGNRLSMNSIVNRAAIDACGMFDPELRTLEDWDLWLRISERFVLIHIPEILVTQRNHSSNTIITVPQVQWSENYKKIIQKAEARMRNG